MTMIEDQMFDIIKDELKTNITSILTSSNIREIKDVKTVSNWYADSGQNKDEFILKSLNIFVEKLMEHVPNELAKQLINGIRINAKNQQTDIKFNLNFPLGEIKPFVQFIKKVNELPSIKIKTVFKVECSVILEGVEILVVNNKKMLNLNHLELDLTVSLAQLGVIGIKFEEPLRLGGKTFGLDVSKITMDY
jgi:hypothetical protein